ncbi:hypothetical protein SBV1_880025 [Verrucomicrobia bacterium]|nr:hypothetical protein SBV1_880025 [Verrucomicrobiota bacterium]
MFWFDPSDDPSENSRGWDWDFHIVGQRVGASGTDPLVYSKNGLRPVKGPNSATSFKPLEREQATINDHNETPVAGYTWIRWDIGEMIWALPKEYLPPKE